MNKSYLLILLSLAIGFVNFACQSNTVHAAVKKEVAQNKIPFGFEIEIEELGGNQCFLVATLELGEEDYTISPFSPDTFYMHVGVVLEETKNLIVDKTLLEFPKSKPEIDPILNYPVHFIRGKTTYKKKLEIISKDDFKVKGMMEFLLEPICIPYQVEFVIFQNNGQIKIKDKIAKIAPYYKGK